MSNPNWSEKEDKKLKALLRHIKLVQDACLLLAVKLIESGEANLGKLLIAQSMHHDASKFSGIEWDHMGEDADPDLLKIAVKQHCSTNSHHPEFWQGFDNLPQICVAELVCDLYARSQEFGTDLRDYIRDTFMPRYEIKTTSRNYRRMKKFLEMILNKPFKVIAASPTT